MKPNNIKNKILIIFFTLPLVLSLAGCENWEKDRLVKSANTLGYELSICNSKKAMPDDCEKYDILLKELELKSKVFISNYSLEEKQIRELLKLSFELGSSRAQVSSDDSIYEKVWDAYSKTPYYFEMKFSNKSTVELADVNYAIFTSRCSDYKNETFYQRFTHFEVKEQSTPHYHDVYFYKLSGSCFKIEQLQNDFTILTEKQLEKFSNYQDSYGFRRIIVHKFDSWDEAKAAVELRRAKAKQ